VTKPAVVDELIKIDIENNQAEANPDLWRTKGPLSDSKRTAEWVTPTVLFPI